MRGSLEILKSTPSRSFMCMTSARRFSASRTMVRNLKQRKTRPFLADALGRVEDRPMGVQLDGDGDDDAERAKESRSSRTGKDDIEHTLEDEAEFGNMAAVQGNGWKLADVFDGAVPGQAVVHVGNDAQIDAVHAGFLQHILDNAALARSGKKDFVDKLLARMLEERVEGADDVTAGRHHVRRGIAREFDEALEGVAEVADALKVMTQGVRFRPGADNEHIAGILAALESAIEQDAIDQAAQAQGNRDQNQRQENDAPRNVFGANKIEGSSEQEAGGEADLHGEPLFMQEGVQTGGRVEIQPAAGDDQDGRESAKQSRAESTWSGR